jgi:mRNA interferase YafQ
MFDLELEGPFQRDLKKAIKRGRDRGRLDTIIDLLRRGTPLPSSARPHKLSGEWRGYWECHIGPDWLLIYKVIGNSLRLARSGTHAELFE